MKVKRTERGWPGHFICADRCLFRRNTLLEHGDIKIVVSTVGAMETVSCDRYYETMVFHSKKDDKKYHDIDVNKQVDFDSKWEINVLDDVKANRMHEKVVREISRELLAGNKYEGGK